MDASARRAAALGAVATFAVLLVAAPSPARSLDVLRQPSAASDLTGPLVAVVALAAWALAGWLLLTAVLTLLSRVPGGVGRAARAAVRRTAPAALRQVVGAALGVTVLAGVVAAPATATTGTPQPPAPASTLSLDWPAQAVPDLDRPGDLTATPPARTASPAAPDTATAAPSVPDATEPAPVPSLDWPAVDPDPPAAPPAPDLDWPAAQGPAPVLRSPTSTGTAADAVVVQPGDSLWSVAEDALAQQRGADPADADVAAAWPSWWAANRDVVGDDPDLLLPGTALRPPPSADGD